MSELPECKLCGADAAMHKVFGGIKYCCSSETCTMHDVLMLKNQWRTLMTQQAGEKVYLVPTGQISEGGFELHERHDAPVPMADFEVLYTAPQAQPAPIQTGWQPLPPPPAPGGDE